MYDMRKDASVEEEVNEVIRSEKQDEQEEAV